MNRVLRLGFGLLCSIFLATYVAANFRVTSTITHFMPAGADARLSRISELLARGEQTRTMLLSVTGPNSAHVRKAARALATAIRSRPEVGWMRQGAGPDLPEQVYALYFPRRYHFVTDHPERLQTLWSDAALRERARALTRQLMSPLGPMVRRLASADPLGLFSQQLARIEAARSSGLRPVGDQLLSADGRHAFIFVATRASAFDTGKQRPLLDFIDLSWARIQRDSGTNLRLDMSALQRFALASETVIQSDIQRVSSISLLATLLLFAWMFRSLRYLVLGVLPIAFGMLCATSVCLASFGQLHGITLAFGSSLIGVCVDYSIHYFNHYQFDTHTAGPDASMRRVWPALLMGGLTSAVGFAGLALSSFPGIREIAVFSSAGVLSALLSTRMFLPPLMPARPRASRTQSVWAARLERVFARALSRPRWQSLPALAAVALSVAGLPFVHWVDDLRALLPSDPALLAQSERVRREVSAMDTGRFVIASGANLEQALIQNDCAAPRLEQAERDGFIGGYRSLHAWLWSARLQTDNRAAMLGIEQLGERVQRAFSAEGFTPDAFAAFATSLSAPDPGPLTLRQLRASELGPIVSNFVVQDRGQALLLNLLQDVRDPRGLERSLQACPGVVYFDQTRFLTAIYAQFRQRVVELIGLGLVAVLIIVYAHYRNLRRAVAAFLPAVLAACATAAILGLVHGSLTLLHAVALLLILAMGVDYGIFLAESGGARSGVGPTLLSLTLACASTVLSFGLLALSEVPALRAIGETTALGTLLSLVLAPTVMIVLRASEDEP